MDERGGGGEGGGRFNMVRFTWLQSGRMMVLILSTLIFSQMSTHLLVA